MCNFLRNCEVNSITHQASGETYGKIFVGGAFRFIGHVTRIARNGFAQLDEDGNCDWISMDPNPDDTVLSIAQQRDGKILMGGNFSRVGCCPYIWINYIARLPIVEAAIEELSVSSNGSAVTWMRGQSSPEVWRVTFEHSSDGVTWTNLGNGTRIPGGWEIRGISLPFNRNHYVRARGYATGGMFNGSGSLFESVRIFYLKPTGGIVDFDGDGKTDLAGLISTGLIFYTTNLSTWTQIPGVLYKVAE